MKLGTGLADLARCDRLGETALEAAVWLETARWGTASSAPT